MNIKCSSRDKIITIHIPNFHKGQPEPTSVFHLKYLSDQNLKSANATNIGGKQRFGNQRCVATISNCWPSISTLRNIQRFIIESRFRIWWLGQPYFVPLPLESFYRLCLVYFQTCKFIQIKILVSKLNIARYPRI